MSNAFASCLVTYNNAMFVHLKYRDSPHLSNWALYCCLQSTSLIVAIAVSVVKVF